MPCARVGYAANGLLHLVLGSIAVGVAVGARGDIERSGAVEALADLPGGFVLLWTSFLAAGALALFQASECAFSWRSRPLKEKLKKKVKAGFKSVGYAAVSGSFGIYALGGETDSSAEARHYTAAMLSVPSGEAVVISVGIGIAVVGTYFVFKGATRRFSKDLIQELRGPGRGAVLVLGMVGYSAKGVALAVVGVLVIVAAVTSTPEDSTGLDGALKAIQEQFLGSIALLIVAVGLACYGLYSIARAPLDRM